jgi:hypothetical protein
LPTQHNLCIGECRRAVAHYKDFGVSLQAPSGSPHMNVWLLFTFEVLNILLFEIFFISISWFGWFFYSFELSLQTFSDRSLIMYLCFFHFWGSKNILSWWPSGVSTKNCKWKVFLRIRTTFFFNILLKCLFVFDIHPDYYHHLGFIINATSWSFEVILIWVQNSLILGKNEVTVVANRWRWQRRRRFWH